MCPYDRRNGCPAMENQMDMNLESGMGSGLIQCFIWNMSQGYLGYPTPQGCKESRTIIQVFLNIAAYIISLSWSKSPNNGVSGTKNLSSLWWLRPHCFGTWTVRLRNLQADSFGHISYPKP